MCRIHEKNFPMKRWIQTVILVAFTAILCGTGVYYNNNTVEINDTSSQAIAGKDTWAIYWYLCGSDLESKYGSATKNLQEMAGVSLPPNVKIIIETGGAKKWHNQLIRGDQIERYLNDQNGLKRLEELPLENMGKKDTFSSFLSYCRENYPADHTMLLFWNHGGGSLGGVSFDEQFQYDSLSLREIQEALRQVYEEDSVEPPIDLVGFDACYMATLDTASVFQNMAKYMVASEAVEPSRGWNYKEWIGQFAENPDISTEELGRFICDSYMKNCEANGTAEEATMSLMNLEHINSILQVYDDMGKNALKNVNLQMDYYAEYTRCAVKSMNFGGNTKTEGYMNMVDIGSLSEQTRELFPDQYATMQRELPKCVIYKVGGKYRSEASGLSCYFPFDGDLFNLQRYLDNGSSESFRYFYEYGVSGRLDKEGYRYLYENGTADWEPKKNKSLKDIMENKKIPVTIDEERHAVITLDEEMLSTITLITFQLAYIDKENDQVLFLGSDDDILVDWDTGTFKDNFNGIWGSIDGHMVYMELTEEQEMYNIYTIPILLNGERNNLHVAYDYDYENENGTYTILGARKWEDTITGQAGKNIVEIQPGDEITTLFYASTLSKKEKPEIVERDTFTLGKNTTFDEMNLENGTYTQYYQVTDYQGNISYSDPIIFELSTDMIDVSLEK